MLENAPSWPAYEAAKEAHETASQQYGSQSAEAVEAAAELLRIEEICRIELGLAFGL